MAKIPQQNQWIQSNLSDKTGNVYISKNINFDEQGYAKLSPRMMQIIDEDTDSNFGVPVAVGRRNQGNLVIPTTSNAVFDISFFANSFSTTENTGTGEPTTTVDSHGTYFNDLWLTSTDTTVVSKALSGGAAATWTSRITGLTSGKRHYLEVFENRDSICVTNGNVVKQYDNSYSNTTDLTLPSEYETVGLIYNKSVMAVLTRPATSSTTASAYMFIWDGATTSANQGYDTGAESIVAGVPYKGTFVILTRRGELLQFTGGGFVKMAQFPFFNKSVSWGDSIDNLAFGDSMWVEGDRIYINADLTLTTRSRVGEIYSNDNPSGIWCFDPLVGLYHRYSLSSSQISYFEVTDANVNTSTDIMTVSSGTLPPTGSVVRYSFYTSAVLGGLVINNDYYLIRLSDTTFKLAETEENALNNIAIDITSVGSSGTNSFYMFDIVDFGNSHVRDAGLVSTVGDTSFVFSDILAGGTLFSISDNTDNDNLSIVVPYLENRGYIVLPKIFSDEKYGSAQKLVLRHAPLDTNDKIIVKVQEKEVVGLPLGTTGSGQTDATWQGKNILSTTVTDLSAAKTYLDSGGELEMEIIAGAGAGTMVQVQSIDQDGASYSIVLKENVRGAQSGRMCHFILENYHVVETITSDNSPDGTVDVIIGATSKSTKIKIELRGWETTIEDLDFTIGQ